jgi:hypothetical protein
MDRRSVLKAVIGGALGLLPEITRKGEGKIQGVAVLRYPNRLYPSEDGAQLTGAAIAKRVSESIGPGSILCLPGETDEHGNFLWDFRIEGADPGQVKIERAQ